MAIAEILAYIDAEISRLQQVKALLTGGDSVTQLGQRRPRHSETVVSAPAAKKRNLSPEGKARIAEAVKRPWATQKARQKGKG